MFLCWLTDYTIYVYIYMSIVNCKYSNSDSNSDSDVNSNNTLQNPRRKSYCTNKNHFKHKISTFGLEANMPQARRQKVCLAMKETKGKKRNRQQKLGSKICVLKKHDRNSPCGLEWDSE